MVGNLQNIAMHLDLSVTLIVVFCNFPCLVKKITLNSLGLGDWLFIYHICIYHIYYMYINKHGHHWLTGCLTNYHQLNQCWYTVSHYTPRFNEVERGVYWYHLVRLSVSPSVDRIVSALYLQQYSSDPFHICTSYQATSEGVSRVMPVWKFKNLKFWRTQAF